MLPVYEASDQNCQTEAYLFELKQVLSFNSQSIMASTVCRNQLTVVFVVLLQIFLQIGNTHQLLKHEASHALQEITTSHNLNSQQAAVHQLQLGPVAKHHGHLRRSSSSSSSSLGGAFAGFILGPIVFISALIMIWFNEKRAVIDHRRLKLGEQICQQVNPFRRDEISNAHMKLTHITGSSVTNQTIRDNVSNLQQASALKIVRRVEVMEWRATRHSENNNGADRIDYHLGWQSSHQPHAEQRHNDASNWFIDSQTIYNEQAFVGEYLLGPKQIDECSKNVVLHPTQEHGQNILSKTNGRTQPMLNGDYLYFPPPGSSNPQEHGALRVSFSYCPTGPITVMAKTVENRFESFPIAEYEGNGVIEKNSLPACCCLSNCIAKLLEPIEDIHLVEEQTMTRRQIVGKAMRSSQNCTLILRIVTFIMIVLGICMFFSPITILLNHIPLVGGFLSGTVGWVILIGAVIVAIPIYIMAFSMAWLWYHPKVGIPILLVGAALITILILVNSGMSDGSSNSAVKHLLLRTQL